MAALFTFGAGKSLFGGYPVHHSMYNSIPGLNPWMSVIPPNCNTQKRRQVLINTPWKGNINITLD